MTLSAADFHLSSCQATLFTPDVATLYMPRLVKDILPRWADRYNGMPTILPVPPEIPPEVPRAILNSADGTQRCEISPARINVFWQRTAESSVAPSLKEYFAGAHSLLCDYLEILQTRAARIAAVVARFAPHEKPGVFLAQHFCRDEWLKAPLNRPDGFEFHAHKRFLLGKRFNVNSWVRNKAGKLTQQLENDPVIIVEQDLNTLAEELPTAAYDRASIGDFMEMSAAELDVILRLYYPAERTNE